LLKNDLDGLEYVKVWDHPESYYNANFFRYGYYNAKPRFMTSDGAILYYYVTGTGVNEGTGYWQFDYRNQECEPRPG